MEPIVLSGLLGFIVPPVVSFLKNAAWPKWLKVALAVVISGVVALLSLLQDGQLGDASWKQILANVGVVVAVAEVFYQSHFEGTTLNENLESKKVLP